MKVDATTVGQENYVTRSENQSHIAHNLLEQLKHNHDRSSDNTEELFGCPRAGSWLTWWQTITQSSQEEVGYQGESHWY